MPKIQRALISVSDKSGLLPFAKRLHRMGVHLISTGGTAQILRDNKIPVEEVSDVTGFPEMLDGRVKTLHPKIHAGILAQDFQHKEIKEYGIKPIDLVVVGLYPFEETSRKPRITEHDLIENIDIGGVALIRAAAKNFKRVTVVIDPVDYNVVIEEMVQNSGKTSEEFRKKMAAKAYLRTASYDAAIGEVFNVLKNRLEGKELEGAIFVFESHLKTKLIHLIERGLNSEVIDKTIGDVRSIRDRYRIEPTDALHFIMMKHSLGQLADESRPKIVASDKNFIKAIKEEGYEIINPEDE